ncbi:hypothetical protein AQUCO_01300039v1 [Aquilegia coerulea]|uniref:Uncharacterized protein n=1 Tax=Aquilegia coerulea TaxID=218851 RepID=A0A2G5DZ99_AQUCA|nr:hypothetical protein AQUCO_01300039v1 [Aquilegia coerulea]
MGDAYWRYNDARQAAMPPPIPLKRPRSDYDIPVGHELPGYYSREDERTGYRMIGDNDNLGASYDRYLRSGIAAFGGGGESARSLGGGIIGHPIDDMRMSGVRGFDSMAGKGQSLGLAGGKPEISLPPDASNTLFVEGFKEVRLVNKEARHSGGDPLVLCFVDFGTPAQAATAMDALQGYKFDEHDRDSDNLRLQFARYPGPRSGGRPRGRR